MLCNNYYKKKIKNNLVLSSKTTMKYCCLCFTGIFYLTLDFFFFGPFSTLMHFFYEMVFIFCHVSLPRRKKRQLVWTLCPEFSEPSGAAKKDGGCPKCSGFLCGAQHATSLHAVVSHGPPAPRVIWTCQNRSCFMRFIFKAHSTASKKQKNPTQPYIVNWNRMLLCI